jgi:MFS family permease
MAATTSTDPFAGGTPPSRSWFGEPPSAWAALGVCVLAVSAHSALSLAFSVLMKPIAAFFQIDRAVFASAMTARMFLMVLSMSLAGFLTDRFGARPVLAGGAVVVALATAALASVPSLSWFFPAMALIGPGQAAIGSVAASALVLRRFRHRRGLAIGVLNGGDNLLNSLVPLLTGAVLEAAGWRTALYGWAGVYLSLGLLIWLSLEGGDGRARPRTQKESGFGWAEGVRHRGFWLLVSTYVLTYAFITSVQLHLHAYLTDRGHSNAAAGQVLSLQILVGAVGSPLMGRIAEGLGARTTLLLVILGLGCGSLLLWNLESHTSFLAWAVFYGTVNSGVVALLALVLAELFGSLAIGRLMGIAMTFCMASTMLANLYSAAMFDRLGSYEPVWQSYTLLMLVAAVPAALLLRVTPFASAQDGRSARSS